MGHDIKKLKIQVKVMRRALRQLGKIDTLASELHYGPVIPAIKNHAEMVSKLMQFFKDIHKKATYFINWLVGRISTREEIISNQ